MPSRSIIRTGVGPHREPRNRFPAMAAAINLLAARAARVQSRRNLSRSLSPKLDHSHSITRFDRSRTGPNAPQERTCDAGAVLQFFDSRGGVIPWQPWSGRCASARSAALSRARRNTSMNLLRELEADGFVAAEGPMRLVIEQSERPR